MPYWQISEGQGVLISHKLSNHAMQCDAAWRCNSDGYEQALA
ncbi:hypothetical protein APV28_3474 [Comamonas testosteroni]|nr:hypothetical protein APV28_3474 [Comamonas testosteroni]